MLALSDSSVSTCRSASMRCIGFHYQILFHLCRAVSGTRIIYVVSLLESCSGLGFPG
jgi:hypothetical protein